MPGSCGVQNFYSPNKLPGPWMQATPKKKKEWDLNEVWDSIDQNLDDIGEKMQNKLKLKEAEILDMYDKI